MSVKTQFSYFTGQTVLHRTRRIGYRACTKTSRWNAQRQRTERPGNRWRWRLRWVECAPVSEGDARMMSSLGFASVKSRQSQPKIVDVCLAEFPRVAFLSAAVFTFQSHGNPRRSFLYRNLFCLVDWDTGSWCNVVWTERCKSLYLRIKILPVSAGCSYTA